GDDARGADALLGDDLHGEPVQGGLAGALEGGRRPVVPLALGVLQALVLDGFLQDERAGADGALGAALLGGLLQRLRGDDAELPFGVGLQEAGVGLVEDDPHGAVVGGFGAVVAAQVGAG